MSRVAQFALAVVIVLAAAIIIACGGGGTTVTNSPPKHASTSSNLATQDTAAGPTTALKQSAKKNRDASKSSAEVTVRVVVWDDTDRKPLPDDSEIWFRGHGSWWLKPATKFGSAAEDLGRRTVGAKDTIAFYPDGRNGQEILVPFTMTDEMNPNGSARDSINITIGDNEIEIVGLAIEAAKGKATMKFKRGG